MATKTKSPTKKRSTKTTKASASTKRAKAPVKKKASTTKTTKRAAPKTRAVTRKVAPKKSAAKKKSTTAKSITQVVIHYDVGFKNSLYIRGKGARLSWEKGKPLKNTGHDTWVWETKNSFPACEFKILVNDKEYEVGENHLIQQGNRLEYTPDFPCWGK